MFQKVYHRLTSRRYGLREVVLALFFLWVMRFPSVEAMKGAQQRDFGCLIGARRSPGLKTIRRKLRELVEQKQGHRLVMEMARRYADGDIVDVGVLYADGHMKPYYGSRSLGKVWSPQRRLHMPGLQQYFVNDSNGRPLFFLTAQPDKGLAQMLLRLVEYIRSIIGKRCLIVVATPPGCSGCCERRRCPLSPIGASPLTCILFRSSAGTPASLRAGAGSLISMRRSSTSGNLAPFAISSCSRRLGSRLTS